ncbi:MAG: glycosyltransferase family 4 protein [Hydrococcus sp. C42_A2020_068]|uniref:glycosyltransferase family 4 protein n=1 Tax=Pleurocapsa sp. PCC 7327 TaxID=118163 RepID=UPI0002A000A6|nr:glycosyltransferase family 4 protein [Pleurocapsa sp. PCC 7327]AFY77929.1 glycosyltransferase [Pleurocapsa sp. PCC 7327]MBF2019238.1 glycosyltransferase family 4 protein [Hydrococcus sp. C42_A2020_068]
MDSLKYQVVMMGSNLNQKGGIASVEKLILNYSLPEFEIRHITTHDEGSTFYRVRVFIKALLALILLLSKKDIDLLHVHFSERGSVLRKTIVIFVASWFKNPILMHAHGAEFHSFFSTLPKWIQQLIRLAFRQCKGLIALSKTDRELYIRSLQLPRDRVFVLPNPVELPSQVPERVNRSSVNLVFLGRVGQRKGAFDLIEAFANLPDLQQQKAKLILAGDGDLERGYRLVEKFSLAERVVLLGWISPEQRNALMSEADIFVLPSYHEALPMAILEAMGWGLPIIATPVGGIAELVVCGENGLLVTPGNIQQLSNAMKLAIEDEPLRLALGKTARTMAARFDIKNYWHSLEQLYRLIATPRLQQAYVSK